MFWASGAVEVVEVPSVSTANRSTSRLGRLARVGLSSTTGGFKRTRRRRGAGDTTRARVGGFAWVKKPSGICSGRLLHRSKLRRHRAKGSAVVAAAATAPARRLCARGGGGGGFRVTLAFQKIYPTFQTRKVQSTKKIKIKFLKNRTAHFCRA